MATTTNYGFEIPDDTDLVKDGALAMRDLGQDVDTQLFTALGGNYPGLRLVKKQTVGTAVTSVSVTGAFSATYENYKIIYTGGVGNGAIELRFGLNGITANHYCNLMYGTFAANSAPQGINGGGGASANFAYAGHANTTYAFMDIDLSSPFATQRKFGKASYITSTATGLSTIFIDSASSASAFTISCPSGNLTGGTIYVYGYGAS
jgi:hypothetical protein